MTRILVVEGHLIVQQGLVSLLGTRSDLQIVGVAANVREAKPLLDQTMPDILLLDLALQGDSGLDLARALYRSRSSTRVLVMTEFSEEFAVAEAMGAGVAGYFLKDQPTDELFAAIDVVHRGGKYVAPRIAPHLGVRTTADLVRFAFAHGIRVASRGAEKGGRAPKESRAPGRR